MKELIKTLREKDIFKGDKVMWIAIIVLSLCSLPVVYSASANLEYVKGEGTTLGHMTKHLFFIIGGLATMRAIGYFNYKYFGIMAVCGIFLSIGSLLYASVSGAQIGGASAARWISLGGISFQPSVFGFLNLVVYVCWYLAIKFPKKRENVAWYHFVFLFLPIIVVVGLVFKDNGSTGLMILLMCILVLFLGQLYWKYIMSIVMVAVATIGLFLMLAYNTNVFKSTRVDTWKSRIDNFFSEEKDEKKDYQIDLAKAAIIHGGTFGVGAGKSALVASLPQSASDFVFAIFVEEWGALGAGVLLLLYFIIISRIWLIARKMPTFYTTLLVVSLGIMFSFQVFVNIAVALNIMPVTGQPLPLVSLGGTSMIFTYALLGIILNLSSIIQVFDREGKTEKQIFKEMSDIA